MATFIHTADLHLGRQLHGLSLLDDQRAALDSLVELVRVRRPDALLLAGDIYDRAIPPADAVALLDDFLCRVVGQLDVPVVMIAGNHDSAERLGFGSRLFGASKLLIAGRLDHGTTPLVVEDEHGPVEVFTSLQPPRVRALTEDDEVVDQLRPWPRWSNAFEPCARRRVRFLLRMPSYRVGAASRNERSRLEEHRPYPLRCSRASITWRLGTCIGRIGGRRSHRQGSGAVRGQFAQIFEERDQPRKEHHSHRRRWEGTGAVERLPLSVPREFRLVDGTLETIIEQAEAQEKAADKNDYIYALLRDKGPVYDAMARLQSLYPNAVHIEQPGFVPEERWRFRMPRRAAQCPELFADFFETVQGEPLGCGACHSARGAR